MKSNGLKDGEGHSMDKNSLHKVGWYDAYSQNISPCNEYLDVFFSQHFRSYVQSLFPEIPLTQHFIAEFHHHKIGSTNGYLHTDFDVAYFKDDPLPNGLNPWYFDCGYRSSCDDAVCSPRAIALIYYLNDVMLDPLPRYGHPEDWPDQNTGLTDEDGGHTGLFTGPNPTDPDDTHNENAFALIKPLRNRLAMYATGPYSYHAFRSNVKYERNALHMWFHTTEEYYKERYPNHDIRANMNAVKEGALKGDGPNYYGNAK